MRFQPRIWVSLALALHRADGSEVVREPECPGAIQFDGIGEVSLVPTGWGSSENMTFVRVEEGRFIRTMHGSRTYLANGCSAGSYSNEQYLALDLRGKTMRYTTDFSKAGCGCNAALYLTSMRQNTKASECGDYYCDANNVCGESCAEIDIQESNKFAWHSTLHAATDHAGLGKGYGGGGLEWSGPRDWSFADFGPNGRCVDTNKPFQVEVSFPVDDSGHLRSMDVTLSQAEGGCPLSISVGGYAAMPELDAALEMGMTPIVSYWSSTEMLWMDGKGADFAGPCEQDFPKSCGDSVLFYDFSVTPAFPPTTRTSTTTATTTTTTTEAVPLVAPTVLTFLGGIAATLSVEAVCILGVWALRGFVRRNPSGPPPPPNQSPLKDKKRLTSSSQSLLMLAESGEVPGAKPAASGDSSRTSF